MAVGEVHVESHGRGMAVALTATITAERLIYAEGWFGIAEQAGDSGETVGLNIDRQELQIELPAAFAGVKGDSVYIDTAQVTNHVPDDAAYSKTAGAGKRFVGRLTSDQDAGDVATMIAFFIGE